MSVFCCRVIDLLANQIHGLFYGVPLRPLQFSRPQASLNWYVPRHGSSFCVRQRRRASKLQRGFQVMGPCHMHTPSIARLTWYLGSGDYWTVAPRASSFNFMSLKNLNRIERRPRRTSRILLPEHVCFQTHPASILTLPGKADSQSWGGITHEVTVTVPWLRLLIHQSLVVKYSSEASNN